MAINNVQELKQSDTAVLASEQSSLIEISATVAEPSKVELNDSFLYTGAEELSIMFLMKNYNKNLSNIIMKNIEDDSNILDFGAGMGTITAYLSQYKKITCLEIDPYFVKVLRDQNYKVVTNISEIKDNSLSFVYSSDVLEHIEDDYQAILDLSNKIKSNGKAVFYVPAFQVLFSSMDTKIGHFRRYNKKRLASVFSAAGFEIEKIRFCDSIGFFGSLFFKYFSNKEKINTKMVSFYDKFIFPISKFCDIFLNRFFGKNLYIVAKKTNKK